MSLLSWGDLGKACALSIRSTGRLAPQASAGVRLPSLACASVKLTETKGRGTGQSFAQFPIREGDCILADRGYATAPGTQPVVAAGGHVTVRVNTGSLPLRTSRGKPFDLLKTLASPKRAGAVRAWSAQAVVRDDETVVGRVCATRKTEEAIKIEKGKLSTEAVREGKQVHPRTLQFAQYVIVFTTFPADAFTASRVLEWYRVRWQVEPVFKRLKFLAQPGRLPKYDDESANAWVYEKLLAALPVEKLIRHALAISAWAYDLDTASTVQCVV